MKEKVEPANVTRIAAPITWAQEEDVTLPTTPDTDNSRGENWSVVGNKEQKNVKPKRNAWKDKLNILKGTAGGSSNGMIPQSADVHLVAYGFGTDTSSEQIKQWLESNGLQVKGCTLLTRFEGARSLTFRVVVKASDFEKATNPNIWPENVGVRKFKFFNGPSNRRKQDSAEKKKQAEPVVSDGDYARSRNWNPVSNELLANFINKYQRHPDERMGVNSATNDLNGDQRVQFGSSGQHAPFGSGSVVGNIPGPHTRENTVMTNHPQFIGCNSLVVGYGGQQNQQP